MNKPEKSDFPERLLPGNLIWQEGLTDHIPRYEFACNYCNGKRVLDAACGVGYGSTLLANNGAYSVHAIDISPEAINSAKKIFAHPKISFQIDDCEVLNSVSNDIDVIVALECIEHMHSPEKFLLRTTQLLDPSGLLVLSTPNPKLLGRSSHGHPLNPFHVREYTYQDLMELLNPYFGEVKIFFQVRSRLLQLHEDITRFVTYAYRVSPYLRFLLWYRSIAKRPGVDPIIRPITPEQNDFPISQTINDPDLAWAYIAVCSKPRNKIS
jgi:SAM-dependent methyltransferase